MQDEDGVIFPGRGYRESKDALNFSAAKRLPELPRVRDHCATADWNRKSN